MTGIFISAGNNVLRHDCIQLSSPNHHDLVSQGGTTIRSRAPQLSAVLSLCNVHRELAYGLLRWMAPLSLQLSATSGHTEAHFTLKNSMKNGRAQYSFTMFHYCAKYQHSKSQPATWQLVSTFTTTLCFDPRTVW